MSKKKTIFDLFRENDGNFSSRPSHDSWSKLEKKLDEKSSQNRPSGGKMIRINYWAIAASLAIAVGFGALLFIQNFQAGKKSFAFNDAARPVFVEDLVLSDTDDSFDREWAAINDYRARFADLPTISTEEFAEQIADAVAKIEPRRLNQKPEKLIALSEESTAASKLEAISDRIQRDLMSEPETNNAIAKKEKSSKSGDLIAELNWLVGNWEQKMSGMKSVENWVADTFNTISGEGFLVRGDDTVFTEKMLIKQIGDKLYFFQNPELEPTQTPFVLTAQSDSQWIFGNEQKEVILSNAHSGNYRYRMTGSTAADAAFLRKRNTVASGTAERIMTKMN